MTFTFKHVNRLEMPIRHILICEDDTLLAALMLQRLGEWFGAQGQVQFSICPGAVYAVGVMSSGQVDLVILDHDMPHGSGSELLQWIRHESPPHVRDVPVITASGITSNNVRMMELGATHQAHKNFVVESRCNDLISQILKVWP